MEIGKPSGDGSEVPGKSGHRVTEMRDRSGTDLGAKDDIELRLGARLVHLPIVRSVAVNIAMRADFDLDAISDLEMAVDETCSSLITRATPGSTLVVRFTVAADEIGVAAAVTSAEGATPSTSGFGWRVLNTLADSVRTWSEPTDSGSRYLVHIELTKRRPVVDG